jgi:hypothetical protein
MANLVSKIASTGHMYSTGFQEGKLYTFNYSPPIVEFFSTNSYNYSFTGSYWTINTAYLTNLYMPNPTPEQPSSACTWSIDFWIRFGSVAGQTQAGAFIDNTIGLPIAQTIFCSSNLNDNTNPSCWLLYTYNGTTFKLWFGTKNTTKASGMDWYVIYTSTYPGGYLPTNGYNNSLGLNYVTLSYEATGTVSQLTTFINGQIVSTLSVPIQNDFTFDESYYGSPACIGGVLSGRLIKTSNNASNLFLSGGMQGSIAEFRIVHGTLDLSTALFPSGVTVPTSYATLRGWQNNDNLVPAGQTQFLLGGGYNYAYADAGVFYTTGYVYNIAKTGGTYNQTQGLGEVTNVSGNASAGLYKDLNINNGLLYAYQPTNYYFQAQALDTVQGNTSSNLTASGYIANTFDEVSLTNANTITTNQTLYWPANATSQSITAWANAYVYVTAPGSNASKFNFLPGPGNQFLIETYVYHNPSASYPIAGKGQNSQSFSGGGGKGGSYYSGTDIYYDWFLGVSYGYVYFSNYSGYTYQSGSNPTYYTYGSLSGYTTPPTTSFKILSDYPLNPGWNHVAVTRDSVNTIRIFINGVLNQTSATSLSFSGTSTQCQIGVADGVFNFPNVPPLLYNFRIINGMGLNTPYQTSQSTIGYQVFPMYNGIINQYLPSGTLSTNSYIQTWLMTTNGGISVDESPYNDTLGYSAGTANTGYTQTYNYGIPANSSIANRQYSNGMIQLYGSGYFDDNYLNTIGSANAATLPSIVTANLQLYWNTSNTQVASTLVGSNSNFVGGAWRINVNNILPDLSGQGYNGSSSGNIYYANSYISFTNPKSSTLQGTLPYDAGINNGFGNLFVNDNSGYIGNTNFLAFGTSNVTIDVWVYDNPYTAGGFATGNIPVQGSYWNIADQSSGYDGGWQLKIASVGSNYSPWLSNPYYGNTIGWGDAQYGVWVNLTLVRQNVGADAILYAYRDGKLVSSSTFTGHATQPWVSGISTQNIKLGSGSMGLGELKIYNAALTATQVQNNYIATAHRYI